MSFDDPEISLRVFLETASRVKSGGVKIEGLEMVGPNENRTIDPFRVNLPPFGKITT
jgi:hypothetical protein